ncbi:MAG: hypothetical protein P4L61_01440 [Candidatus Pacebacteria bacterium]|nr:hypothetical protein [Candidatus Paceibacterota bacterium]
MIRPLLKAQLSYFPSIFQGLLVLSILFVFFSLSFAFTYAQTSSSANGIDITINPTNPVPGKNVVVSVSDYLTNISTADIIWTVDGQQISEGIGEDSITLTAPSLGKTSKISVLIKTEDGEQTQKSMTIKSGSVDLVWESQGYAPPLYGGKQDFAYEDSVKVVAMPHLADSSGVEIDPATLVYNWQQNSTNLASQSGYGKQSIVISGSIIPQSTTIHVTVSTRDGSKTTSGVTTLHPGNPSLVFYSDDPLYGALYNMALGAQTTLSNQEITLLAVPYSFNVPSLTNNDLEYNWTINGTAQAGLAKNRSVTLRVEDTSVGASYPVQLQLQNMKDILQGANDSITVVFNANKNKNAISI